jgi:MEMO1 family protein
MLAAVSLPASAGRLRALVVPHAGIVYSGRTAAHGFARLQPGDFTRVIVMAPNHRVLLRGAAVDASTAYETPLGRMPVDVEAVHALAGNDAFDCDARPFVHEHAIEMQLPFLQLRLPAARLVPVLVGDLRGGAATAVANALRPLCDERTLLVVSSDFTHFGPQYGYVPFQEDVPARIEALDHQAIGMLAARQSESFEAMLEKTGATICGRHPLAVLLELAAPDWRGELCAYTTSGAMTGDYANSVSYACLSFCAVGSAPGASAAGAAADAAATDATAAGGSAAGDSVAARLPAQAFALKPSEQRTLLLAAREALRALFVTPDVERRLAGLDITPRLHEHGGVFVSLHRRRDGRLRGCIGTLQARQSLLDAVVDSARAAAERDPRFPPLHAEELPGVEIEVSVLGPLLPVHDVDEIVIGQDGLVVTQGLNRGVLLPQVAVSQRWTRDEFLDNVCRKADLPADAWRQGARIERFAADVFSEADFAH